MYLCSTELFSIEQIIYIKMDLALNNLQRLICHKTQQTKPNPQNQSKTESINFPAHQRDRQDFTHILFYFPFPVYKITSSIKSQTPFQWDLHNSVWPLNTQYLNKVSNPFLGETSYNTSHFYNFSKLQPVPQP